jgi:hypothetical protein
MRSASMPVVEGGVGGGGVVGELSLSELLMQGEDSSRVSARGNHGGGSGSGSSSRRTRQGFSGGDGDGAASLDDDEPLLFALAD